MDRAVLAGIAIGAAAGGALRVAFGSNWFLITAVVAIYAGWGYFEVRYRRLLWSEFPTFDRSADRLGYAIGLFGVTLGTSAFGQRYAAGGAGIEFLVGYLGVIGFLLTSSRASADADSD
ncbi:hypothetical protein [Haloterrigena salifodinae]|uniref:hypothetical protein n=1 Tax=Haloterrigena salifodinae TaxID=2675099 RepID=UPI000F86C2AF|nr:hypothetical protein [Haloterrigena salifodinae]